MKRLLHPLSPATGTTQFENAPENYIDPTFSATIIAWQKQHGRHALPWQNTRDAYLIWLSEIMLQQTQVTAVLGYYARFLERFPTLRDLAAAPVEDVMAQWSGLGYYTRAFVRVHLNGGQAAGKVELELTHFRGRVLV